MTVVEAGSRLYMAREDADASQEIRRILTGEGIHDPRPSRVSSR